MGGDERAFDTLVWQHDSEGFFFGSWKDDDNYYLSPNLSDGRAGSVSLDEGYFRLVGYVGLETPQDKLGDGSAIYSGSFYAVGDARLWGPLAMEVDFAEASITGTAIGYFDGGSSIGDVSGTLFGSRLAGVFVFEGEAEGELAFVGAVYGDAAQNLAGGVGGTMLLGGVEATLGGSSLVSVPEP